MNSTRKIGGQMHGGKMIGGLREILVVFIAATLLFLIQPVAGQRLMATYGGSPSVWLATLLFFQFGLFLGYVWGYWIGNLRSLSAQAMLHCGLLIVTVLVCLPVDIVANDSAGIDSTGNVVQKATTSIVQTTQASALADRSWFADLWQPLNVLSDLAFQLLLPVICLSSVSSLIQNWGARQPGRRPPYWLYSISNLASLAALAAYPFWIQPLFDLQVQQRLWTSGFMAFVLLMVWNLVLAILNDSLGKQQKQVSSPIGLSNIRQNVGWLMFSFLPAVLLMATTQQITADVAAGPLFWTLPLAAYLATFTVAFAIRVPGGLSSLLANSGLIALVALPVVSRFVSVPVVVSLGCGGLFFVSLECHRQLALRQPEGSRLPAFYVWLAAGGLLGGLASNLLAPLLFTNYYELEIAALATAFVLMWGDKLFPTSAKATNTSLAFVDASNLSSELPNRSNGSARHRFLFALRSMSLLVVVLFCCFGLYTKWPIHERRANETLLSQQRTFHGVLRVIEKKTDYGTVRTFGHGWTDHGSRLIDGPWSKVPSGYYCDNSGVAFAFSDVRKDNADGLDVCVLGLGAGSLLSWRQADDQFDFVEIDPQVVRLQQEYFAEMNNPERVEFYVGDGRKFLENSKQEYDLVVLDAFSGDSVPCHLLTVQAMESYLDRCRLDGVLAINISNRYLDFRGVLKQLAYHFHLDMAYISYRVEDDFVPAKIPALPFKESFSFSEDELAKGWSQPDDFRQFTKSSDWVLLSRAPFTPEVRQRAEAYYYGYDPIEIEPGELWRDDFSPILPLLK